MGLNPPGPGKRSTYSTVGLLPSAKTFSPKGDVLAIAGLERNPNLLKKPPPWLGVGSFDMAGYDMAMLTA